MSYSEIQLPQANRLERVVDTVRAVAQGHTTPAEIAHRLSVVERQGAYYREAAAILDFIQLNDDGCASLTWRGERLLSVAQERRQAVLRTALRHVDGVPMLLAALRAAGPAGCAASELERQLQQATSLSPSTTARRLDTLLAWVQTVGWVGVHEGRARLIDDPDRLAQQASRCR